MAKIRVQELAKELNVSTQDIMKKLEGLGIFVPNPMSTLTPAEVAQVKSLITGKKITVVKKKVAPAPAEAPAKEKEPEKKPETAAPAEKPASAEKPEKAEKKEEAAKQPAAEPAKQPAAQNKPAETKPADSGKTQRPGAGADRRPESPTRREDGRSRSEDPRQRSQEPRRDGNRPAAAGGDDRRRRPAAGGAPRNGEERRPSGSFEGRRDGARPGSRDGKDARDNRDNSRGRMAGGRNDRKGGSDISIPQSPKMEDKPRKTDWNNRSKDKNRSANNGEEYNRKRNTAQPILDDDGLMRKKKKPVKKPQTAQPKAEEPDISVVTLPETMTVKEFAEALHRPMPQIIKELMGKGIMAGMNQTIDFAQAEEIALEMGILAEHQQEEDIFAAYAQPAEDKEEDLQERPPVVVVMGHVDHGKTSLLDAIRNTRVTEGEAGGITQHIGASVVEINGRKITFLDTPGHEAFTAMRMRGAQVTDIAILVVAADDGVMPQTIEAINHAKAAGIQIIVAINKMDKPGANPDRIKQELTEHELVAEDWGGTTICVPVSAKKREGIDTLLEMVLLVADMGELKANPNCPAVGTIIESQLDKGRGAVATVLVQKGTLRVGDTIVAGSTYGRVKAMVDDKGRRVKEAGPSKPVEIIGLSEVPAAGEMMYVTPNEKEARQLAEKVSAKDRAKMIEGNKKVSLNDLFGQIQSGNVKELNIIVKADVQGSVEAVKQSLEKLSNDEVAVRVIHGAVGAVTESDVMLASASNSIIIGFNVRPDATAKSVAEEEKVDIRLYRVIYNAIEDIEAAMKGMLDPEFQEKVIGHAQVRQVFKASGVGTIAGSYVTDGKISRNAQVRLVRDGIVVHEGELGSLRRFKDDVKEVAAGYECGIMFAKFSDIKEGDVIEAFVMEEIQRD